MSIRYATVEAEPNNSKAAAGSEPGNGLNLFFKIWVTIQHPKSQMLRIRDCGRSKALRALSAPEKRSKKFR